MFEQYDPIVQSRTVRRPDEADAAVLALPDSSAIAVAIDGNGRRVACDPRRGAAEAVYECAANLACVGAEPLGLTNCLNFGNPEKPHVAWQLVESVEGLAAACEELGVPVVGGNVSLYNEAPTGPIFPTPVVGIVGKLPDAARAGRLGFAREGDSIALIGAVRALARRVRARQAAGVRRSGSCRPSTSGGSGSRTGRSGRASRRVRSAAPTTSPKAASRSRWPSAASPAVSARRSRFPDGLDPFGEAPGRGFIVSGPREALAGFVMIGEVGGDAEDRGALDLPVSDLREAREAGLSEWV